jgi:hypothetical protein
MPDDSNPIPPTTLAPDDRSDGDDFRDQLVRGQDQWWEFLDGHSAEQQKPPAQTETDQMDRPDAIARPTSAPTPSSRSFQCRQCDAHNPADATFCFFCGAQPSERLGYQHMLIVIEHVPDPRLRARIAGLLGTADKPIDESEIKALLADPPCYLLVDGPPGQIEAMLERLSDLGLRARGTTIRATGLGWYREIAESFFRHQMWLGAGAGITAVTIMLWVIWSSWVLPIGAASLGWLLVEHARWYQSHFRLRADAILEQLAGFQSETANRARQLLSGLRDDDVRKSLSVCLMEYYAVWHQIHASDDLRGPVSRQLRGRLQDFLDHLLDACEAFDKIHRFIYRPQDDNGPRIADQKRTELEDRLQQCRGQLVALTSSIESLRAKLLTVDVEVVGERADMRLQGLLQDMDTEAEVLEETLEEMAHSLQ